MKRSIPLALLTAAATGLLVGGTAAAGSAAGAKNSSYAASWSSTGAVVGSAGGLTLTDYATAAYYDRVTGSPSTALTVGGATCARGNAFQSGLSVYGADEAWAQMPVGSASGARVELNCLVAGVQHRYHWGNRTASDGSYVLPSSNCVQLVRTAATTFTLRADSACPAQDEVVNTRNQQLSSTVRDLPFDATITVPGFH